MGVPLKSPFPVSAIICLSCMIEHGADIKSQISHDASKSDLALAQIGLEKIWIAFGQSATASWIPVHQLVHTIGPSKASAMPFFHDFTGCDVVCAFRGKGKK